MVYEEDGFRVTDLGSPYNTGLSAVTGTTDDMAMFGYGHAYQTGLREIRVEAIDGSTFNLISFDVADIGGSEYYGFGVEGSNGLSRSCKTPKHPA